MSNEPSETQKAISEWAPQPAVGAKSPSTNELPVVSVEPASAADPAFQAIPEANGNAGSAGATESSSATEPQPGAQFSAQPPTGPQSPTGPQQPLGPPPTGAPANEQASRRPARVERRPQTGTIVWGVLMLAFCAYMAVQILAPDSIDITTFVIAGTIGLGVILLAVGAIVVIRSNRNSRK